MKLSDQYEIVNRFRRQFPVNVEGLAEALGVDVRYASLSDAISGMLERRDDGRYRITVNANHAKTRQRFTIAHELGHYLLHRKLVGDGVDDDRAYRITEQGQYHNTCIGPREETEANKFAANVLMPMDAVSQNREYLRRTTKEDEIPAALAQMFGVSEHAMSIRLGVPYREEPPFVGESR